MTAQTGQTGRAGRVRAAQPAVHEQALRRDIGALGLLFTAVGSIIGSGWLFGALYAAQQAGPAAIVSWVIGGVMILFIGLVYAELGTMFPVSGGVVRFPHLSHGSLTSYSVGWITWLAAVTVAPIEVEAALQYATNYLPWLTHTSGGVPVLTGPGYGVAAGLLLVFSFVNVMGVRTFARFNTAVVWWKLAIITLVIIAFVATAFAPAHFTMAGGFMPYGAHGMFTAIASAGIVFSYLGFRQGIELAGESRNPHRNVPLAIIGAVLITMLLYVALQVAFVGAVPSGSLGHGGWAKLAFANDFGPLAGIASLIGLSWLAALLYADAIISPADTGLIYTTVTSRISYGMGRNRNAPHQLARVSRRGVPWVSVLVTFVVGLLVFLPFPGWQKLVSFITSATVLSFGSGPITLLAMRRQLPDHPRPFRLPVATLIAFLAFYSSNLIVYWAGWETNSKLFAAIGIGFLLLAGHELLQRRRGTVPPALEWRAFTWVPLWLAGLVAISWLGSFGGGAGVITFAIAFPVIAVFSVLVMWVGVSQRLSPRAVEAAVAEMRAAADHRPAAAYPQG